MPEEKNMADKIMDELRKRQADEEKKCTCQVEVLPTGQRIHAKDCGIWR